MAQRKRFTRVEMARVLMERNQYKGIFRMTFSASDFLSAVCLLTVRDSDFESIEF